jgi:hypothetical protein
MTEIRTLEDVHRHNAQVAAWRSPQPQVKPVARPEYIPMRQRKRGMNRWEEAYANHLSQLEDLLQIETYWFEPIKLKLADGTYYTPDFGVMRGGKLEFHEVKGFMREAARVRLNVAAEKFPFPFYLVKKARIGWSVNRVGSVPRGTEP